MGIENLQVNLSGGATNSDPTVSTGGVKSSVVVHFQTPSLVSAIPGVVAYNAAGNTTGTGTLVYLFTGKTITWIPPGESIPGTPVAIGTTGRYIVRGSGATSGYVVIDVTSASLSNAINYSSLVTIADVSSAFLPGVSKDTAYTGATEYFLYYLSNDSAAAVKSVSVQIMVDTPGLDTLSVAIIAAKNTTELQAAASGHTYSAVGVDLTMGDMNASDYWGFWIRRVTPALTVDGITNNTFKLRVKALT